MELNTKDFISQAKLDMPEFIRKAIDDLLEVLNSPIVYPTNFRTGLVNESRLYIVVKSREQVYLSVCELMELIEIDQSNDVEYKEKIIEGLKTTWHEMTAITTRNIGYIDPFSQDEYGKMMTEEERKQLERESVSDDYMASIAQSKEVSAKIAKKIIERIALLENPDAINEEKLEKQAITSIVELYAD